jgi:hypothetical protein
MSVGLSIDDTNLTLVSISSNMNPNTKPFTPSKNSPPPPRVVPPGGQGFTSGAGSFTPKAFAQALMAAFQGMTQAQASSGPTNNMASAPSESGVMLTSGVGFRAAGPGTDDELDTTSVLVTRQQRQALQNKPEALKKLRDRVCVTLSHTLQEVKWSDILDATTDDSDVGSAMKGVQAMLDAVRDFAVANDPAYVCNIPLVKDVWDEQELATCSDYKNVLSEHTFFSETYVRNYQAMINVQGFAVDAESSYWLQIVLEKSTELSLLTRVKQCLNSFDKPERGGIMMFFLITSIINKPSFEFIQTGQDWIKKFKLSNFAGEHVPTANSRFKAVIGALVATPGAMPPTSVDAYLRGMCYVENDEFKDLVKSLIGSYSNPIDRIKERFTIPQTTDIFGRLLKKSLIRFQLWENGVVPTTWEAPFKPIARPTTASLLPPANLAS